MSDDGEPGPTTGQPFGLIVVDPGGPDESTVAIVDRLFVGRECAGVDDAHRVLLTDDLSISRNHLEIRVDPDLSQAVVVDTSSNGVRVNGIRIERSVAVPLASGDRIHVGEHVLEFRGGIATVQRPQGSGQRSTVSVATPMTMALIVGDLINFSTVSETANQQVLMRDVHDLYSHLRALLAEHRGTLVDYVGDAFFASWELEVDQDAATHALLFALDADDLVRRCTADYELRYADGSQLRMGWGSTMGPVVMQMMPGSVVMVLGDAVNLGFRISSLAGRDQRPTILATEAVKEASDGPLSFGDPEQVTVKGRVGVETIYGVFRG